MTRNCDMAKKSNTGDITYAEAVADIEEILARLRGEEIGVDELAREVTRATELITFCKRRLYDAETAVTELLDRQEGAE